MLIPVCSFLCWRNITIVDNSLAGLITIQPELIKDARPAEEQQKIRKLREEKTKLEEELRLASAKMKELEYVKMFHLSIMSPDTWILFIHGCVRGHNYTPFALNTPIRIRNKASSKSIHLEWDNGSGNKAVRQNDSIASDLNQQVCVFTRRFHCFAVH